MIIIIVCLQLRLILQPRLILCIGFFGLHAMSSLHFGVNDIIQWEDVFSTSTGQVGFMYHW